MTKPERVAVVMNTFRDDPSQLTEAIRRYLDQANPSGRFDGVWILVSTVEGDPAVQTIAEAFPSAPVDVEVMPAGAHPGRGPAGIYAQLNAAVARVVREGPDRNVGWITYASGTDEPLQTKLDTEVACCLDRQALVCYSSFYVEENGRRRVRSFRDYDYKRHLKGNFVSDCALMRLYVARIFYPFQARFGNHAFWDFWLRVYEGLADVFAYNPEPTWIYKVTEDSQHQRRKRDPEKVAENERLREFLLSLHG